MQIVRVRRQFEEHWGLVEGDDVYRLPGGPIPTNLSAGEGLGPIDDLQLLAPVVPSKIVCVGRNFAAHAAEPSASPAGFSAGATLCPSTSTTADSSVPPSPASAMPASGATGIRLPQRKGAPVSETIRV